MLNWNISIIKQCWRYLHSGEASVSHQNWTVGIPFKKRTAGATPSHDHYFVTWLSQILISEILIHSDVKMSWYFSKVASPYYDGILAPGEECHLDFSPKSCTYPTLVTRDPLELNINLVLLYKIIAAQRYFAPLPLTIAHFLPLTVKKCCVYPYFQ